MKRRDFVRALGIGAAAGLAAPAPLLARTLPGARRVPLLGAASPPGAFPAPAPPPPAPHPPLGPLITDAVRLVVLHTNDTHSRMDPFRWTAAPSRGSGAPRGAPP